MKFIDEYRDKEAVQHYLREIFEITTRAWNIMEVCGGQTHAIVKYGIDQLLPRQINLVHGPGCPVCVTPVELIDKAIEIASQPGVILCSFGDMLRVPGSKNSLLDARAGGAGVRIIYSPLDALKIAIDNKDKEVVFFAVGFETTAPANAMAVYQAHQNNIDNFSMLVSHVLVPPAMEAILSAKDNCVDGFLAAGHVCTIMGCGEYQPIAEKYRVPIVITGFEPLDIAQGVYMCIRQLEAREHRVENQYSRSVNWRGNLPAQRMLQEIFYVVPRKWRGVGKIPHSGLGLNEKYRNFDAEVRFGPTTCSADEVTPCISGEVLRGVKKPHQCPAFGNSCTPEHPLGATMVSSEGACAAYYLHRLRQTNS